MHIKVYNPKNDNRIISIFAIKHIFCERKTSLGDVSFTLTKHVFIDSY